MKFGEHRLFFMRSLVCVTGVHSTISPIHLTGIYDGQSRDELVQDLALIVCPGWIGSRLGLLH